MTATTPLQASSPMTRMSLGDALADAVARSGADAGALGLTAGPQGPLFIVGAIGLPRATVKAWQMIPLELDVPFTSVFRRRRPVFLGAHRQIEDAFRGLAGRPLTGHASRAALPLLGSTGLALGALGLTFVSPQPFDDDQQRGLLAIAGDVSAVVEHHVHGDLALDDSAARLAELLVTVEATDALMGSIDDNTEPSDLCGRICAAARRIAGADGAELWALAGDVLMPQAGCPTTDDAMAAPAPALAAAAERARTIGSEYVSLDGHGRLPDSDEERVLSAAGVEAVLQVPMSLPQGRAGVLTLSWRTPPPHAPAVAQIFALRRFAAIAADAVERVARRRDAAVLRGYLETLRTAFAPPTLPQPPHLEVAARLVAPLEGFTGDFYDLFPLPSGEWACLVGDVVGHGPDSAALAVTTRHTMRAGAYAGLASGALMQLANDAALTQQDETTFCTAVFGRISSPDSPDSPVRIVMARAGHPYPMVRRADGRVDEVATGAGGLLGAFPRVQVTEDLVVLEPGDVLVLYTDGVIERRTPDGEFGMEGVRAVLRDLSPSATAQDVVDALLQAVAASGDGPMKDDTAVLALRAPDQPADATTPGT